jgi:hypothetical protein
MSSKNIVVLLGDGFLGFIAALASGGLISINIRDGFVIAITVFGCVFIIYQTICSLRVFARLRMAARGVSCCLIAAFCLTFLYRVLATTGA